MSIDKIGLRVNAFIDAGSAVKKEGSGDSQFIENLKNVFDEMTKKLEINPVLGMPGVYTFNSSPDQTLGNLNISNIDPTSIQP